jgi:hypothetical protein
MARRSGIKEKVHLPIYDSIRVEPRKQLRDVETGNVLRFFIDDAGKSKLETNQSVLSRFKRFEAWGMRVMINGAGSLITKLIYNSVTALIVGESTVIELPTWFFFGEESRCSRTPQTSHRTEPPTFGAFRFAEPITIDKQQNFRVQIEFPQAESLKELRRSYGPMSIWVVLDGDLTRDS